VTPSDVGSIAGAGVALAALIVSLVSLHKTNKFGETTDRLNRILIDRETAETVAEKKADLSANLIEVGKNKYRLKVFNRGKGTARNVRLIDLASADETFLIQSDIDHRFPVPILEQHQAVELIAAIHMGSPLRAHIKLQWDDEMGSDHEKELTPAL